MLELTVKTLDSENHSFTVPDETTVRQLKENILEKMEVPIEIQRLIFHGKVLQDEKKLTDYGDVNGKVIHLVQRPPPPPPTRGSNSSGTTERNLISNIRRSIFGHRDRIEGTNTTYLGAMAFPTDLMEAQGMIHPPPSQGLSRTRLLVAKRMIDRAALSIMALENEGQTQNGESENNQDVNQETTQENANQPRPTPNTSTEEGRDHVPEVLLRAATGSIVQAANSATAAAIAAAVSAAQAAGVPHITIRGASGEAGSVPPPEAANSNLDDVNLFLHGYHPEDVAAEVEIGANNEANTQDRPESDSNANNLDNSASSSSTTNPPWRAVQRTSRFAALLNHLDEYQRRFQPLLRRCQHLMFDDPSFNENSSPNAEECQRLFNGVSETMHYFAHAYHALSDIMVDFNEDTPRALRCRPVIIQQTAIVETGFPIQINLGARRTNNGSNSNLSTSDSSHQSVEGNLSFMSHTEGGDSAPPSSASTTNNRAEPNQEATETENVTSQASASSFASAGTQQSEDRSTTSQGGTNNNTSGFFLSGPGNVEIFMDFGLQGTGRPPIELIQSVQAVAGQIQSQLLGRVNQASQADQPPPPYEPNFQQGVNLNDAATSNHSVSTQPRSTSSAESTNSTPTMPSRRQIHMGHMNPGVALMPYYDPFLPCNSHHVRSPQRSGQNSQGSTRSSTGFGSGNASAGTTPASAASNPSENASAGTPNVSAAAEGQRPSNASAEGVTPRINVTNDSYVAIMSPVLNPPRFGLNRGQGGVRPPTGTGSGGDTFFATPPEVVVRRFCHPRMHGQQQQQAQSGTVTGANETQRNFGAGAASASSGSNWRVLRTGHNQPGTRGNALDQLRSVVFQLGNWDAAAGGGSAPAGGAVGAAGTPGSGAGSGTGTERNPFGPNSTIFDFWSSFSNMSYVEGECTVTDFFMILARNLTWSDMFELLPMGLRPMIETLLARFQNELQTFVVQRLLQGDAPTRESIARGSERLCRELRPYLEVLQQARIQESIDIVETIDNYNRSQMPELISMIVELGSTSQPNVFGQTVTTWIRNYMRHLLAIIIHCCQDGVQGFNAILQYFDRWLVRGVPEVLQQWVEVNSLTHSGIPSFTANLNVPTAEIQRYIVYRKPTTAADSGIRPTETFHEPMETDAPSTDGVWVAPDSISSTEKVDNENLNDGLVGVDNENLPDVLIGSETWHNSLPSEWVPIIARDTQRQRRQSAQKPFSDAYLSSLPAKRRKLITSAKPQGNLSQVISDGVRQAITAAGVSSPVAEKVIAEAGKDDVLQAAYKEQERICVSADLKRNPDFSPSRFPNAFKYFDK